MSYNITEQMRVVLAPLAQYGAMLDPQIRVLDCTAADTSGDGSWARPFKTFQQAIDARPAVTSDRKTWGYTVLVQPGVYPEKTTYIEVVGNVQFIAMGQVVVGDPTETPSYTTKFYVRRPTSLGGHGPYGKLNFTSLKEPQILMRTVLTLTNDYTWEFLGDMVLVSNSGDPFNMNVFLHGARFDLDPSSNPLGVYLQNPVMFPPNSYVRVSVDQCFLQRFELGMSPGQQHRPSMFLRRSHVGYLSINGGAGLSNHGVHAEESSITSMYWFLDDGTFEMADSRVDALQVTGVMGLGTIRNSTLINPSINQLKAVFTHGPVTDTIIQGGTIVGGIGTVLHVDGVTNYWIKALGGPALVSVAKTVTEDLVP